jgi:hypothetical protein
MTSENPITLDQPVHYQIVIQGRLPENWNDFFGEMTPTVLISENGSAMTTLNGTVSDQSSLHGLLRRIRDLGLPLLEVKRLSENNPPLEGVNSMSQTRSFNAIFNLACKAVALALAVAALVLNLLKSASSDTLITLVIIGLAALALSSLQKE